MKLLHLVNIFLHHDISIDIFRHLNNSIAVFRHQNNFNGLYWNFIIREEVLKEKLKYEF